MTPLEMPSGGTLVDVLASRAQSSPGALAYEVEGETICVGALAQAARRVGGELARSGLAPGDRCALALPTSLDFVRVLFALQWLGALPVAFNPSLPPGLTAARARRLGCSLVVAEAALAQSLAAEGLRTLVPAEAGGRGQELGTPRPGLVAFLQLTSGTSGEPRAAVISQAALLASLRVSVRALGLTDEDVFAAWVPLHHDLGLVRFVFLPLFAGRPCHLVRPSLAGLRSWLATVARVGATITAAPDFVYRLAARIVDPQGLDLSRLRIATSGGEPVRSSTIREFEARFGVPGVVRPGYGLAEATLGVSALRHAEPLRCDAAGHVGCGRALPGTELKIVDEQGQELPPWAAGQILVRGPSLFDGYLDDAEATQTVLSGGWLHTGDVGALAEDGELFVHGRQRALIKRAGAVVAPREIEEAVDRLEGVRLSAAVGTRIGDDEDVCVIVEPLRPLDDEARATLERTIAAAVTGAIGFAPGRILLAPPRSIPRTANGKIRHAELALALARGDLGSGRPGPQR